MIREIILRHFKRFDEETFDLDGHVILAGPNNCGKTTVLQAIAAWVSALQRWQELNDFQRHGGAYTKAPLARQAFAAVPQRSFELMWTNRAYSTPLEIEVLLSSGSRVTMEFLPDSTEQVYVRPKRNVEPAALRELTIDVVHVATIGGLNTRELILDPASIEMLLGEQRPGEVVRNLLLQVSRKSTWSQVTEAVQRLFGVELLVPQTSGGQILCEYRQTSSSPHFDILNAGAGMQQVIMLLSCLYWRAGSVILVDEPDAHLHVFLQDSIFSELQRAAAATKSQLVLATHSEVIFNSASAEQICVMLGHPRRLTTAIDLQRLKLAVTILEQSDLVAALEAPGILYLEGYTDLDLLREWARILQHPLRNYLDRTPFWRAKKAPGRPDAPEVPAKDHFDALRLVNEKITGVWLVDADGKRIPASETVERAKLNRIIWKRYETESYLVHPLALARFIDLQAGTGGLDAVRAFLQREFVRYAGASAGAAVVDDFIVNPAQPAQIVEQYLAGTKARTQILNGILQEGGVHGMSYTDFRQIAAVMTPEEIHPEVIEKLDFIHEAFGL